MLQAIAILGGWLLMMGQHDRWESLFYYFRIEDQVPQNHLLRLINRCVSFDFVRESTPPNPSVFQQRDGSLHAGHASDAQTPRLT